MLYVSVIIFNFECKRLFISIYQLIITYFFKRFIGELSIVNYQPFFYQQIDLLLIVQIFLLHRVKYLL